MKKEPLVPELQYYTELLGSLFEFMMLEGGTPEQIEQASKTALGRVSLANNRRKCKGPSGIALAAQVLDSWHRNRRYLDQEANPRPIPLAGRAPSVEALVRSERPNEPALEVARRLVALGLLIRAGSRYLPAGRAASVRTLHPFVVSYVAKLLQRALSTVRYNVSSRSTSAKWLEGFAEIPNLSSKDVAAFRRFSREQGWIFLTTINEWLEARRSGRKRAARATGVSAGVQVFAWAGETQKAGSRKLRVM